MDGELNLMSKDDGGGNDIRPEESESQSSAPATGSDDGKIGLDDSPHVCDASNGVSETVKEAEKSKKVSLDNKAGGNYGAQEVAMMTREEAETCLSKMRVRDYSLWCLAFDFRKRNGATALEYPSFEKCLEAEIGISRTSGIRWADAWEISINLGVNRDKLTIPERTLRLFNPFKPDSQLAIYREATARHEDDGKVLPGHLVKAVIDVLDKQGVLERKARSKQKRQEAIAKEVEAIRKGKSDKDLESVTKKIKDAGVPFAEKVVEDLTQFIDSTDVMEESD